MVTKFQHLKPAQPLRKKTDFGGFQEGFAD